MFSNRYAQLYCYMAGSYRLSLNEMLPQQNDPRPPLIVYYQWTPVILILMAISFITPYLVWKGILLRSGVGIDKLLQLTYIAKHAHETQMRQNYMNQAAKLFHGYLNIFDDNVDVKSKCDNIRKRACLIFSGRFTGDYLATSFVVVKFLYVANALAMLFYIDVALGFDYHAYGFHVLSQLLSGKQLAEQLNHFPRLAICDLRIRQKLNVNRYTFMCALPLNMINEVIFTCIWFWIVIVILISAYSFLCWFYNICSWRSNVKFVKESTLFIGDPLAHRCFANELKQFCRCYLRKDGLLLLRLVESNSDQLTVAELIGCLWEKYTCPTRR